MKLSDIQLVILSAAAQHPDGLASPPARLAPAPQDAVRKSLLAKGLIEATNVPDRAATWMVDGERVSYRITSRALTTLGIEAPPDATPLPAGAPQAVEAPDEPRKRKGITITVLERVRQVGPNKEGAKGSYSIYRLAEAGRCAR